MVKNKNYCVTISNDVNHINANKLHNKYNTNFQVWTRFEVGTSMRWIRNIFFKLRSIWNSNCLSFHNTRFCAILIFMVNTVKDNGLQFRKILIKARYSSPSLMQIQVRNFWIWLLKNSYYIHDQQFLVCSTFSDGILFSLCFRIIIFQRDCTCTRFLEYMSVRYSIR